MKQIIKSGAVIALLAGVIVLLSVNHHRMMKAAEPAKADSRSVGAESKRAPEMLRPTTLPAPLLQAQACNIESIGGGLYTEAAQASSGSTVAITGWLLDTTSQVEPANAELYVVKAGQAAAWSVPLKLNLRRDDVAKLYGGSDEYRHSGFDLDIDLKPLNSGQYHLYLIYGSNGHNYVCDNGRILQIKA